MMGRMVEAPACGATSGRRVGGRGSCQSPRSLPHGRPRVGGTGLLLPPRWFRPRGFPRAAPSSRGPGGPAPGEQEAVLSFEARFFQRNETWKVRLTTRIRAASQKRPGSGSSGSRCADEPLSLVGSPRCLWNHHSRSCRGSPSRSRLPLRAPSWLCMQSGAFGRFKSKSVSLPVWERTGHGEKDVSGL